MATGKMGRLLALSDTAFNGKPRAAPKLKAFKARPINGRKFDRAWERYRGAAARFMAMVLREDSEGLYAKVSPDAKTAATFGDAVAWLTKEAELLRKTADRHELAANRLKSAVCRYRAAQQQPKQAAQPEPQPEGWTAGAP